MAATMAAARTIRVDTLVVVAAIIPAVAVAAIIPAVVVVAVAVAVVVVVVVAVAAVIVNLLNGWSKRLRGQRCAGWSHSCQGRRRAKRGQCGQHGRVHVGIDLCAGSQRVGVSWLHS